MPQGQVKNHSSKTLWVVENGNGSYPARGHKLSPGRQSPTALDADGFKSVDGTPVDGHVSWVKVVNVSTADVADSGSGLTRGCLVCYNVQDGEFGPVTYEDAPGWGEPLS
jgi:hypothetical protein